MLAQIFCGAAAKICRRHIKDSLTAGDAFLCHAGSRTVIGRNAAQIVEGHTSRISRDQQAGDTDLVKIRQKILPVAEG